MVSNRCILILFVLGLSAICAGIITRMREYVALPTLSKLSAQYVQTFPPPDEDICVQLALLHNSEPGGTFKDTAYCTVTAGDKNAIGNSNNSDCKVAPYVYNKRIGYFLPPKIGWNTRESAFALSYAVGVNLTDWVGADQQQQRQVTWVRVSVHTTTNNAPESSMFWPCGNPYIDNDDPRQFLEISSGSATSASVMIHRTMHADGKTSTRYSLLSIPSEETVDAHSGYISVTFDANYVDYKAIINERHYAYSLPSLLTEIWALVTFVSLAFVCVVYCAARDAAAAAARQQPLLGGSM